MIAGNAPVAELVDAPDSKSGFRKEVLVRFRPGAPTSKIGIQSLGVLPCGLWPKNRDRCDGEIFTTRAA
jgi:hypothetical protein